MFWFSLQILFETFPILRKIKGILLQMCIDLPSNVLDILVTSNLNFRKTLKHQITRKSTQKRDKLFYADRGTNRQDEANSRFSKFCQRA